MTDTPFIHTRTDTLTSLNIDVETYTHTATGLVHYHLSCDNTENALMIGFATQPMSSRGEAHILEHLVLCGSDMYPVRDPFFSMIKRSLQTFMNAMTASDWTVYPFATQNRKDFFNLLSVYADAVFFPTIHPLDFAQEGIRTELDEHGNLQYHGIVFNEMKGAMSGEIDQLYYALAPHIFGTTTYHYNSGGNPADIPNLTHQDLVKFHQTYYHPSNAIVMSFGDISAQDIQQKLQLSLAKFDNKTLRHGTPLPQKAKRFFVSPERRHTAPIKVKDTYTSDSEQSGMTHQVIAWLLPAITDPKLRLALRLMEGVLIEHSGLPLRRYLETTPLGLAPSPLLGLDDSHHEMVFYAGLRGSEIEHTDAFETEILALLSDVASRPINDDTIQTVLHQMELDKRHIGGDGMPYGLTLMLEAFSTAIHGGNPVDVWQVDEHLDWIKDNLKDLMWLPNLIKTHLIDNPHRVQLTLSPDKEKANALVLDEQRRLAKQTQTLSDEQKANIIKDTKALQQRQGLVDDVELLPKVGLEDIPHDVNFVEGKTQNLAGIPLYQYDISTNGLYYYQLMMKIDDNDIITHPLLPLYLALLSEIGTKTYDARSLQAYQARHSSGVTARISQRTDKADKHKVSSYFILATRALNHKLESIDVVKELTYTIFDETDRIKELLTQRQMSWQSRLANAGHSYAMQTASRTMSLQAAIEYAYSGLPALSALKSFLAKANKDDTLWHTLSAGLANLHARMMALPKSVILVCEPTAKDELHRHISQSLQNIKTEHASINSNSTQNTLPDDFEALKKLLDTLLISDEKDSTAWLISTNVYHNAQSHPAVPTAHPDAAALMVLAPYLRNGYLHNAIREKGGAYGGGASYDGASSSFRFYSYRDPNCQQTFAHFDASVNWLLTKEQDPRLLEEAILSIIASMDKPGSPAGDAVKSCMNDRHGRGKDWQSTLRQRILSVTTDDLQRVARTYLQSDGVKAVLAPADKADTLIQMGFDVKTLEPLV